MSNTFDRLIANAIAIGVPRCPTLTIVSIGGARSSRAAYCRYGRRAADVLALSGNGEGRSPLRMMS
jgi:hypothetical protein